MTLKTDAKNPRLVRDEMGNELFIFTGVHLDDLREILSKVNDIQYWIDHTKHYGFNPSFSKEDTEI